MSTPWVVVGAGLSGATVAERIATVLRERVLVVEKSPYVGGTASDYVHENGVLCQRFGPHVFHTNSDKVWKYVNAFATWRSVSYQVVTSLAEGLVPLPIGFAGVDLLMPGRSQETKEALVAAFGEGARVPLKSIARVPALKSFYEKIYQSVYEPYTRKHWGVDPEILNKSVLSRVPIVVGDQHGYFNDTYQAMPVGGYTKMIERMLDHSLIQVVTGVDYLADRRHFEADRTVFTGPIDEFFGCAAGRLPYRSLRFETTAGEGFLQPVATVNYPSPAVAYTRSTEFKHLTGQDTLKTVAATDHPCPYVPGENEPLYPVPCREGAVLYEAYAAKMPSNVFFCGRLGEHRYYNMDQAIASALALFESQLR